MSEKSDCASCSDGSCAAKNQQQNESEGDFRDRQELAARMCQIGHKLMVLSGKGGVGKSTVAVNLAAALAAAGKRVGLLDIDIHGPSIPKLLHIEGAPVEGSGHTLKPVRVGDAAGELFVMSIGLLLNEPDTAVIWRGPMKYNAIKQFLKDVEWGTLDYLIVDAPPGTGDEPLAVAQLVGVSTANAGTSSGGGFQDGAVIVTTPQQVAVQDVRRSIMFCRQLDLPVVGVIENMSGFRCPKCGEHTAIFGADGGQTMAEQLGVPFLGAVPIDPMVVVSGDSGMPLVTCYPHSPTTQAFGRIVRTLLAEDLARAASDTAVPAPGTNGKLRIAVPVAGGQLASHFGHCERFAIFDVSSESKTIESQELVTPPQHEPGVFPRWLHELGTQVVITGGMGVRAQSLFTKQGITVIAGAAVADPEAIVRAYLEGNLETGPNACDH